MLGRKPVTQAHIIHLLEENHLLSAPDIVKKMNADGTSVNKTSVYRALDKMLAAEIICKQIFGSDVVMYELRENHHDHFVCENCGKIEVVACTSHPHMTTNNLIVNHHHMTLFGFCESCST